MRILHKGSSKIDSLIFHCSHIFGECGFRIIVEPECVSVKLLKYRTFIKINVFAMVTFDIL